MARCSITLNLGSRATPGQLASLVTSLSSVSDLSLQWANLEVAQQSRRRIEELASSPERELRSRLPDLENSSELEAFYDWQRIQRDLAGAPWDMLLHDWERLYRRYGSKTRGRLPAPFPFAFGMSFEQFAPEAFDRLVALETADRQPEPIEIERAVYENPLTLILYGAAIVIGGGGILGILPEVLRIARDWSADRRTAVANATEAEQKAELLKIVVERVRERPSSPPATEVVALLDDDARKALALLGQTDPIWEELPDEDG